MTTRLVSVLIVIIVSLLMSACRQSEPIDPPQTCQEQLISELEAGVGYGQAARNFMDCAGLTIFDLIRLLS